MIQILIVDDEPRIRQLIREYLEHEGFSCTEATDGSAALAQLSSASFDLVLLDIMMPFVDGMTCLKEMRARKLSTPVIMLTARGEEYDRVAGLEGGADDYIVKPFSPREMVARFKAVLARTLPKEQSDSENFVFGDLVIDTASHSVKIAGEEISLTPKEFDLLVLFVQNKNVVLCRDRIFERVWNEEYLGDSRTVDLLVQRMRKKLGLEDRLTAVYKVGYRLEE